MAARVLIDTSVWVDFFRTGKAKHEIELLLGERRAVYCGLIVTELMRGARGKNEITVLNQLFDSLHYVHESNETFLQAGRLGFLLAKNGLNLATVDLILAQVSLENNLAIFTYDQHFKQIKEHTKLRLF